MYPNPRISAPVLVHHKVPRPRMNRAPIHALIVLIAVMMTLATIVFMNRESPPTIETERFADRNAVNAREICRRFNLRSVAAGGSYRKCVVALQARRIEITIHSKMATPESTHRVLQAVCPDIARKIRLSDRPVRGDWTLGLFSTDRPTVLQTVCPLDP